MAKSKGFDAKQINGGALSKEGREIEVLSTKIADYEIEAGEKAAVAIKKAENLRDTRDVRIGEAKKKCDKGGFKAFVAKYCPELKVRRINQILEVALGKKTAEEVKKADRERKAETRKNEQDKIVLLEIEAAPTLPKQTERRHAFAAFVSKEAPTWDKDTLRWCQLYLSNVRLSGEFSAASLIGSTKSAKAWATENAEAKRLGDNEADREDAKKK